MENKRNAQNKTKQDKKTFELFFSRLGFVSLRINQKFQCYMEERPHVAWRNQLPWLNLMFSVRLIIKCWIGNSDGKLNENIYQRAEMRADKKETSLFWYENQNALLYRFEIFERDF